MRAETAQLGLAMSLFVAIALVFVSHAFGTLGTHENRQRQQQYRHITALGDANTNTKSCPLIVSGSAFHIGHRPIGYHPENQDRVKVILEKLKTRQVTDLAGKFTIRQPSADLSDDAFDVALTAIKKVHDASYVDDIKMRCDNGATSLSASDSDTYLSRNTFDVCVLAQSAWIDCAHHLVENGSFAFAVTRPPGHHAERKKGCGFCVFNFAAATAIYVIDNKLAERVAILDFDVHYGNGVADIVKDFENIRYVSLHQEGIFPSPPSVDGLLEGVPHNNVLTVNLRAGFVKADLLRALEEKALPFLEEKNPQMLIVCAGFDGLESDELAGGRLVPSDYADIGHLVKRSFGDRVLYGLEGGYSIADLPSAVEHAISPWIHSF